MNRSCLLVAASLAFLAVGCETETVRQVKIRSPFDPNDDADAPRVTRLDKLKERVEKDPKDVQGWFALGEFYETSFKLADAAACYERGNSLMEPGRYTGGEYLLARVYMRAEDWERSIAHLNRIFVLEPKDPKEACLNPYFREAHYLRGAIYFLNRQYRPAKKEFFRFMEIGGDENRVEDWLDQIQAQGE
jgi:tetratricopeptide (TPR) repeat protein